MRCAFGDAWFSGLDLIECWGRRELCVETPLERTCPAYRKLWTFPVSGGE